MTRQSSWRGAFVRSTSLFLAIAIVFTLRPANSAPTDIFNSGAPLIGADPPKASDLKAGDASVSTQTGALTYSYPIAVPPGRNGLAPSLSLNYSSQGAIYGGIAAGWSMDVARITEDTSYGRLFARSPEVEAQEVDPLKDDKFVSTAAGGQPLIPVNDSKDAKVYKTYRAMGDTSFTRYERMFTVGPNAETFYWRARRTDGSIAIFGDFGNGLTSGCTNISERNVPLTRVIDSFGNEIRYQWARGGTESVDECVLKSVSWGYNPSAGISTAFAKVDFNWGESPCSPLSYAGAARSYRTGELVVSGASKLFTITATSFAPGQESSPEHTRVITLGYNSATEQCNQPYSPYRSLASIQESAWGPDAERVDLPAVTFQYNGVPNLTGATEGNVLDAIAGTPLSVAWGHRYPDDDRWPTVESMMLDIDGDGLLDRVENPEWAPNVNTSSCHFTWRKNLGPHPTTGLPTFAQPSNPIDMPTLKWASGGTATRGAPKLEGCSLSGQVTAYRNTGKVGLPPAFQGDGLCNIDSLGCDPTTRLPIQNPPAAYYCNPGGTECPTPPVDATVDFRTILAYRWLDMNSDGLVDLVAAVHGNINYYDIERGDQPGKNLGEAPMFGIPGYQQWPSCNPSAADSCKQLGEVINNARTCSGTGVCSWNWTTVTNALNSASAATCFDVMARIPSGGTGTGGGIVPTPLARTPYTRCEGMYPWLIYWNKGGGSFATQATVKYQPVPLESEGGDSNVSGPGVVSPNHMIMDFDGDGDLDAVVHAKDIPTVTNNSGWFVWMGDGTGGFYTKRHFFPTRIPDGALEQNAMSAYKRTSGLSEIENTHGVIDMNGDGLPDQWVLVTTPTVRTNVTMNDGAMMRTVSNAPLLAGEIDLPVKPGNDSTYAQIDFSGSTIRTGNTSAKYRTVDLDHDGRPDVYNFATGVYWNMGGQFRPTPVGYPNQISNNDGITRRVEAVEKTDADTPVGLRNYEWRLLGDLIDVDGNGIAENYWIPPTGVWRNRREGFVGPPRTMTSITNGRGATTTITYDQMHKDPADTTRTVVYDAAAKFTDSWCTTYSPTGTGCPKASPRPMWVVKSMTTVDSYSSTTNTTSYRYWYPRYAPDNVGRYGFRGFAEVQTIAQSGARTIDRYAYDIDWSGRLVESLNFANSTANSLRSINRTTYAPFSLFGAVTTYLPTQSEKLICSNAGSTEALCTAASAPGYSRTITAWVGYPENGTSADDVLYVPKTSRLTTTAPPGPDADGDRRSTTTYQLESAATIYRVRPTVVVKEHRAAGTWQMFGKTASTWDSSGAKVTDEVWSNAVDGDRSITRYVTDNVGNVLERWKPEQHDANTTRVVNTYDARRLFVASVTNELGHQIETKVHSGTGAQLQVDGPNTRTCTTSCPSGPNFPVKQQVKTDIDGLGRPRVVYETFSADGASYQLFPTQTIQYGDLSQGWVRTYSLIDHPFLWREQLIMLDGLGRPKSATVYAQGTAPADHITSYAYANEGTLTSVTVPDPSVSTGATVTYSYTYDTLGRALTIRRPDSPSSGIDISYNGVTSTATEVTNGSGTVASTISENDKLGRLWKRHEKTGTSTWAITTYAYGPDDNITSVTDPSGSVVTMGHDLAGRRTSVTRGARVWSYVYDKNGNIESERIPSPNPVLDAALYTNVFLYDDLDRVIEKQLGQRALSNADRDLFAASRERFWYDSSHIGALRYWKAFKFGMGDGDPSLLFDHYYDGGGRLTSLTHTGDIDGVGVSRGYMQSFDVNGLLIASRYRDVFAPGTNETLVKYVYDARGLPSKLQLQTPQLLDIGVATRNVAGLVTKRRTDLTGAMTYIESNLTYDKLGRGVDQDVQRSIAPTRVVRQELSYFANDDVAWMRHYLGAANKKHNYTYDARHQITGVTTDNTPTYFSATYQYGTTTGAGRLSRATQASTSASKDPRFTRSVNYVYGGSDSEQVTSLTNVSGGATYASYTYDLAGNQVTRSYPATNELYEYTYDGQSQLRRVIKKVSNVVTGSEEYWYGSGGERIAVLKRNASGTKTDIIWFIGGVEAHYNGSGNLLKTYSHLSLGTPLARIERTSNTTTNLEFQFHGVANNTIAAVAQNGTINTSFSYAPFGEVLESTNAGGAQEPGGHKRRSNDKYQDDVSSLTYYGARYYDKVLIGWSQADPLYLRAPDLAASTPRHSQLYMFTLNNPNRYVDPDGLDSLEQPRGLSSYRSEAEQMSAGWAANMASDGGYVDKNSCGWNSNRCSFILGTQYVAHESLHSSSNAQRQGGGGNGGGGGGIGGGLPFSSLGSYWSPMSGPKSAPVLPGSDCLNSMPCFLAIVAAGGIVVIGGAEILAAEGVVAAAGSVALRAGRGLFGRVTGFVAALGRKSCFTAGTLVHTPTALVPIEALRIGDEVVAYDSVVDRLVTKKITDRVVVPESELLRLRLAGPNIGESLQVTSDHPFFTRRGWVLAGELTTSDSVVTIAGEWSEVVSVATEAIRETVYNLEVEDAHTYFVSRTGFLVHNGDCPKAIARKVVAELAKKKPHLFQYGECEACANAISIALRSHGIPHKVVKGTAQFGFDLIGNIAQDKRVTDMGFHVFVEAAGVIFDNLMPEGIDGRRNDVFHAPAGIRYKLLDQMK